MNVILPITTALFAVSVIATLRTLILGNRVAAILALPRWDRATARRVLFRGVVDAPEAARPAISRFRVETLVYFVLLTAIFSVPLGAGVLIIVAFLALTALASEPLAAGEYRA